jgi:hypothetical protein
MSDDDMCPNCVTPWKCNGPHLSPDGQWRIVQYPDIFPPPPPPSRLAWLTQPRFSWLFVAVSNAVAVVVLEVLS